MAGPAPTPADSPSSGARAPPGGFLSPPPGGSPLRAARKGASSGAFKGSFRGQNPDEGKDQGGESACAPRRSCRYLQQGRVFRGILWRSSFLFGLWGLTSAVESACDPPKNHKASRLMVKRCISCDAAASDKYKYSCSCSYSYEY